jgi:hypothetical protein
MTEVAEAPQKSSSVSRWKQLGKPQPITLPSGTVVKIKVPDLAEMLRAGEVPNELVAVAAEARDDIAPSGFDLERVKEATDFMRFLVSATVVEPKISPEDVPELPVLDRDVILEFALRQRDTDAVGHQLYGLELLADWRRFRGRGTGD